MSQMKALLFMALNIVAVAFSTGYSSRSDIMKELHYVSYFSIIYKLEPYTKING